MNISTSLKTLPLVPVSIGRGQETGMVRMGGGGESLREGGTARGRNQIPMGAGRACELFKRVLLPCFKNFT